MKRLGLRKIWIWLVTILFLTSLLNSKMEKSSASAPAASGEETTAQEPLTGQMKIWFETGGEDGKDLDFADKDGLSTLLWKMPATDANIGFSAPNTGYIEAFLSINGREEDSWKNVCDRVKWTYTVAEEAQADAVATIAVNERTSTDGRKAIIVNPKSAGIIDVNITAIGCRKSTDGTQIFQDDPNRYVERPDLLSITRQIYIGVPLQIRSGKDSSSYKYTELASSLQELPSEAEIYANNASLNSCKVRWFYLDAETGTAAKNEIPLKAPNVKEDEISSHTTSKLIAVSEKGPAGTTTNGVPVNVYKVSLSGSKRSAGFVRLVGRVYFNNDSRSDLYVEDTFDVLIAPEIFDDTKTMAYGESWNFQTNSSDAGRTLAWTVYEDYNTDTMKGGQKDRNEVLLLEDGAGFTANNYGTVFLEAHPLYIGWEKYYKLSYPMKDIIQIHVEPTMLKGTDPKIKVEDGGMEIINVGESIQLSANVVSSVDSGRYVYEWIYEDGTADGVKLTRNINYPNFSAEGVNVLSSGNYSAMIITGKKSGEDIKIRCNIYDRDQPDTANGYFTSKTVTIRIADTLKLSGTQKAISVGGSFTLDVLTQVTNGSQITWYIDQVDEEYIEIEAGNRSATITGLKSTDDRWITVRAQMEMNGITMAATCQVKVLSGIEGAHIQVYPSTTIPVGGTVDLELILESGRTSFTSDEIKWIIKDKGYKPAEEIIKKEDSANNILKTKVTGLDVGEAYAAVVLNDSAQIEIAIVTIRVVSEVTGIEIKGDKVIKEEEDKLIRDYLNTEGTGTCQLKYDLLPLGFADDKVEVVWTSNNTDVAEINEKTGVVTYKGAGTAVITAMVAGMPSMEDTVTIVLENPAFAIEIDKTEIVLRTGETEQLSATVLPDDGTVTDASVIWESSNPDVAEVDEYGLVTAVSAGITIVTAATSNGLSVHCMATVFAPAEGFETVSVLSIKGDKVKPEGENKFVRDSLNLQGRGTCELKYNLLPLEYASDELEVIWRSNNPNIAEVDKKTGVVTYKKAGAVIITAMVEGLPSVADLVILVIENPAAGIELNTSELNLILGETAQLRATVLPETADASIIWESSNPRVATVDQSGLVTTVSAGRTVITAATANGLQKQCIVMVRRKESGNSGSNGNSSSSASPDTDSGSSSPASSDTNANNKENHSATIINTDIGFRIILTNGGYVTNQWRQVDGKWYFADETSYMAQGWKMIDSKWYYLDTADGSMTEGWKQLDGKWYYLNPGDGTMAEGWKQLDGKWYYLNFGDGTMAEGWKQISGKWYYLNPANGECLIDTVTPDGYRVDETGAYIQ